MQSSLSNSRLNLNKEEKLHEKKQDFHLPLKRRKKTTINTFIPRVIFAIEIKDNYVHLVKDTKPIIAFYYDPTCPICASVEKFFLTLICETHYYELANTKQGIKTCSEDFLLPLRITIEKSQDSKHPVTEKNLLLGTKDKEEEENAEELILPEHHKIVYRMRDGDKHYFENILLYHNYKSERGFLVKLKNSLHILPSQNKWNPQPHQEDAKQWFQEHASREEAALIHWGLGSGKTSGILYSLESNRHTLPPEVKTIYIVCPNTIIEYWHTTIVEMKSFASDKSTQNPFHYIIVGYTQFEKMCHEFSYSKQQPQHFLTNCIVVVDECHYFRNVSNPMKFTLFALQYSYQTIGSTGTLFINDVEDILGTILLMKGSRRRTNSRLFSCEKATTNSQKKQKAGVVWDTIEDMEMEMKHWQRELFEKKNSAQSLSAIFEHRTHYFDPQVHDIKNVPKFYPLIERHLHRVPMSLVQMFEYLLHQKRNLTFANITFSSSVRNAYNTVLKSMSNTSSYEGADAKKFQKIVETIQSIAHYPQVIFSRFLSKGVKTFQQLLLKLFPKEFEIELISGQTPTSQRQKIIDRYNKGQIQMLLLCDVGGESIDLHGTVALHLMETFDNLQSEQQTIHRVARYNSHDQKVSRATVQVHNYISFFSRFS